MCTQFNVVPHWTCQVVATLSVLCDMPFFISTSNTLNLHIIQRFLFLTHLVFIGITRDINSYSTSGISASLEGKYSESRVDYMFKARSWAWTKWRHTDDTIKYCKHPLLQFSPVYSLWPEKITVWCTVYMYSICLQPVNICQMHECTVFSTCWALFWSLTINLLDELNHWG